MKLKETMAEREKRGELLGEEGLLFIVHFKICPLVLILAVLPLRRAVLPLNLAVSSTESIFNLRRKHPDR